MRCLALIATLALALTAHAALQVDDSPGEPGEWGFRPVGDTLETNPPGFSWRPVKEAKAYALHVARDEAFSDMVYTIESTPWSAHCPPEPFAPGTYYWRYAAIDDAGTSPWSTTRSFTVNADTTVFPMPTPERQADLLPDEHPRLFFRPEDIPHLRELAAGPLADRFAKIVNQADKLLAKGPDTSEPPKYPADVNRKDKPGEWRKIWWGNRERVIAVGDAAATLGFVYRLTGDEKYALAARDILLAMAQWDEKGSTEYRYNDEAAMPALYLPARAYSWIHPVLNADDRAAIVAMMRERGAQCFASLQRTSHLWQPYNSHHNRAWHKLGELAIAFYGDIPEAPQWLDYAMTIFYTAYPVWGGYDGGWHEGIAYWSSYTNRFMYWAYAARAAFGIDVFERPFYKRVGDYAMYTMPPGTTGGAWGDQAEGTKSSSIASLMAVLANGARNPHWKWYAEASGGSVGGGYLGFIYSASAVGLEVRPPADLPGSAAFMGVGVAVLNTDLLDASDNVQIHFKSSPFGRISHGYNSNNAFLLHIKGERVFVRSGKRDLHGSPFHQNWMWHTKSDNAILVNGESQIKKSPSATGEIVAFDASSGVDVVVGEARKSYENLDRWTRRIVFLKPDVIVIHDVLDAPEPSTFEWMLHAIGEFAIDGNTVTWNGDPGSVKVQFLAPDALNISQTDQYDVQMGEWVNLGYTEWHLTAQAAEKATHREFLTFITVNNPDAASAVEQVDGGMKLSVPAREASLVLTQDGFSVDAPSYSKSFSDAPENEGQ